MNRKTYYVRLAYVVVLSSLLFWSGFAYYTMNQLISIQKGYAKIINLSGKQRMLSQKTTLIAKRISESNDQELIDHYKMLFDTMKKDHNFILNNLTTQHIENIYYKKPYELDKKVQIYFALLENFYLTKDKNIIKQIEEYSFRLLPQLNYAVNEFEKESNKNTSDLKSRETLIFIGTLITLFLEVFLLIIPIIRKVEASDKEILQFNETLQNKLEEQRKLSLIEHKENIKKEKVFLEQAKLAAMGEMIGNIAHQWRQPLSVISTGASGMKLQNDYNLLTDEMINKTCDAIDDNAQYLSKTIDYFRDFIIGNRTKTIFNLTNEIDTFLNLVEGTIKSNNISIIVDLTSDIQINGYQNELTQCFINIFNNAKDVLNEKKVITKLLFISTSLENNTVVIKIKDNAGGILEDVESRIFEPYFTTKHKSQGTGLGLSMTYSLIVDCMNGSIEANNVNYEYENKRYAGAEFTITLPLN